MTPAGFALARPDAVRVDLTDEQRATGLRWLADSERTHGEIPPEVLHRLLPAFVHPSLGRDLLAAWADYVTAVDVVESDRWLERLDDYPPDPTSPRERRAFTDAVAQMQAALDVLLHGTPTGDPR